jgi:hypothetical protein
MNAGTRFRGIINNEVFEVVEIYTANNKPYCKIKHLKSGKVFNHSMQFVEHLQIEILRRLKDE